MALHYTRRNDELNKKTSFQVTEDMVFPGQTTSRPVAPDREMAQYCTEQPEASLVEETAKERVESTPRRYSWLRFLLWVAILALLIMACIIIGS